MIKNILNLIINCYYFILMLIAFIMILGPILIAILLPLELIWDFNFNQWCILSWPVLLLLGSIIAHKNFILLITVIKPKLDKKINDFVLKHFKIELDERNSND